MDVVDSVFSAARDAIRSELAESDEDDDDDDDDGEEESAGDIDLNTSSGGEGADPQSDLAELRELEERLDQVEQRNQELEERLEEKEATIDRLESETRSSAGRKGISPAASGGSADDGGAGAEDAETREPSEKPTNALDEAMHLTGE